MANIILKAVAIVAALNLVSSTPHALTTHHDQGLVEVNTALEANQQSAAILEERHAGSGKKNARPHQGQIQSTRPMYWFPTNVTLPLNTNWHADGWRDCEIWQKPRNVWGCHEGHGIQPWLKFVISKNLNPREELRKVLQDVIQDPYSARPYWEPRHECVQPEGAPKEAQLCVSWAEPFFDLATDLVVDRIVDKALSCGNQGFSAQIMTRMVDWENRVICISNRPKGCRNTLCNDTPSLGAFNEGCNFVDWVDTHLLLSPWPLKQPPPCVKRSPAEQLDQFDGPLDMNTLWQMFPFYGDIYPELRHYLPGLKGLWIPIEDIRQGKDGPFLLPIHPSLYNDNLTYHRPALPENLQ